jgi:hypothetical protein
VRVSVRVRVRDRVRVRVRVRVRSRVRSHVPCSTKRVDPKFENSKHTRTNAFYRV